MGTWPGIAIFAAGLATALPAFPQSAQPSLTAGPAELRMETGQGGFALALYLQGAATAAFRQANSLAAQVEAVSGTTMLQAPYSQAALAHDTLFATGTLRSANGTVFDFKDVWTAPGDAGVFFLSRQVTVNAPSASDRGFATRFSLPLVTPAAYADCEFLAPGHWYRDNTGMTGGSLAANYQAEDIFIREDRLPLPLILMRHAATGHTLMLLHRDPDGGTILGDNTGRTLTDARLQYASLGVHDRARPSPGMWFPGSEGDRSYYGGAWAYRRHPVATGADHRYAAAIRVSRTEAFSEAAAANWEYAFGLAAPALRRADLAKVHAAGIDLLSRSYKKHADGSAGFPFRIDIPGGAFGEYAMQMGFIGQNLPGANELIRAGLRAKDEALIAKGEAMVDFWARQSPGNGGLPKTWYDAGKGFRPYQTFLRIAGDGMLGALRAWRTMRAEGRPRPAWLAYAKGFGAWLLDHQEADGSFARQYDFNTSAVLMPSKTNTVHAIPLLAELFHATSDVRYRTAALKAGAFAWADVHEAYRYVGGTPDNPDVRDKEAGVLALDAFLALNDLEPGGKWLAAARQAALYVETWAYAWPVPVVQGDDSADFPAGRDQTGLSLIAIGHSGADNFLACGPFAFFRLYAMTGDKHFLDYARFLLHNTKQGMDWDASRPLGYAFPGLQTEAGTVCAPRGHSLKVWLPWVSVVGLVPMSQLEDVFGSADVDILAAKPLATLRAQDSDYAASRGYGPGSDAVSPRSLRVTPRERRILDILGRVHPRMPANGIGILSEPYLR